jgi:hypothetical protein
MAALLESKDQQERWFVPAIAADAYPEETKISFYEDPAKESTLWITVRSVSLIYLGLFLLQLMALYLKFVSL